MTTIWLVGRSVMVIRSICRTRGLAGLMLVCMCLFVMDSWSAINFSFVNASYWNAIIVGGVSIYDGYCDCCSLVPHQSRAIRIMQGDLASLVDFCLKGDGHDSWVGVEAAWWGVRPLCPFIAFKQLHPLPGCQFMALYLCKIIGSWNNGKLIIIITIRSQFD